VCKDADVVIGTSHVVVVLQKSSRRCLVLLYSRTGPQTEVPVQGAPVNDSVALVQVSSLQLSVSFSLVGVDNRGIPKFLRDSLCTPDCFK